jgi:hypothetical protein
MSELASAARRAPARRVAGRPDLFISVRELNENAFFAGSGVRFPPTDQTGPLVSPLSPAQALVLILVTDPSLRGLKRAPSFTLGGV